MKPFRLFFSTAALALALLMMLAATTTSFGASKAKTPPPPIDTRILIKSVDAGAGTIVIQYMRDKSTHTYTIDDLTAVTVNNSTGKIADVKAGMQIDNYVERDPRTLDTLTVSFASPAPQAPTK